MKRILASVLMLFATSAAASDACERGLPASLLTAIEKAYPTFRMPRESDNWAEDIRYNLQSGGSGCLGVASADFDGDGERDYLLGLSSREEGTEALVAIALARGNRWQLRTLSKWRDGRDRLYVEAGRPGIYRLSEALDGPVSGEEALVLDCPRPAAIFGAIESTGVAWCLVGGVWRHTQFSD